MLYDKNMDLEKRFHLPLNGPGNYRVRNHMIYTYNIEINAVRHCNLSSNKEALEKIRDDENFTETLHYMIHKGLLAATEVDFRLTDKGKCFIDNLYMALLSEEEREHLVREVKIHCIE